MPKKAGKSFEVSIAELEAIISNLEKGECTLEESIKLYKEGMTLAAQCQKILTKAEQEIFLYEEGTFKKINGDDVQ